MARKKKSHSDDLRSYKHPLVEVFGFPVDNYSDQAQRYRKNELCPFNNNVPNCTKDKANDPLGTCCIHAYGKTVITCPIRFQEDWLILDQAAHFFFPKGASWTSLTEVRLKDKHGESAGNIDVVLVQYDEHGHIIDFGALEIQSVYITGNVRKPFEHYLKNPTKNANMDWSKQPNNPRPDFLSSSRKRLAPQLIFKGGILNAWKKKLAVALDLAFFEKLPELEEVSPAKADLAWMVYELQFDSDSHIYRLKLNKVFYSKFAKSLRQITVSRPGPVNHFLEVLQTKLDEKLDQESINKRISLDQLL